MARGSGDHHVKTGSDDQGKHAGAICAQQAIWSHDSANRDQSVDDLVRENTLCVVLIGIFLHVRNGLDSEPLPDSLCCAAWAVPAPPFILFAFFSASSNVPAPRVLTRREQPRRQGYDQEACCNGVCNVPRTGWLRKQQHDQGGWRRNRPKSRLDAGAKLDAANLPPDTGSVPRVTPE